MGTFLIWCAIFGAWFLAARMFRRSCENPGVGHYMVAQAWWGFISRRTLVPSGLKEHAQLRALVCRKAVEILRKEAKTRRYADKYLR